MANESKKKRISKFLKLKTNAGNEQVVFSAGSSEVKCLVSGEVIAIPAGGRIKVLEDKAKIIQEFD
ncbi:30S ribosomal protein S27e [Candidatus Micrarchaeota archaeon CG10_big_fil_rev_8_21_14_0_10_45_29]|nr:MAG: 30S ribosomal protein S27e [Candidatus Micrarchaeota archaeon CG10_big_fil_rev_8_21_14_0_10_45_29]